MRASPDLPPCMHRDPLLPRSARKADLPLLVFVLAWKARRVASLAWPGWAQVLLAPSPPLHVRWPADGQGARPQRRHGPVEQANEDSAVLGLVTISQRSLLLLRCESGLWPVVPSVRPCWRKHVLVAIPPSILFIVFTLRMARERT